MKAYLVSEASLVELSEVIDLGRYILLNRGEEKTGGRRKRALLADAYERFLRRELREKVMAIDPTAMIGADYKSALQERLQAVGAPSPEYMVVEALGPDHRRTFRVELRIGGQGFATGEGRTIKLAQQEAAQAALSAPDFITNVVTAISEEEYVEIESDDVDALAAAVGSSEESDSEWAQAASGGTGEGRGESVSGPSESDEPQDALSEMFDHKNATG
jgi:hypothetical protein